MSTIKIFRHGYDGFTKTIINYAANNGFNLEIVKNMEEADFIILDDESLRPKYYHKNKTFTIREFLGEFSNNVEVSPKEFRSILDQLMSMDNDSRQLGTALLLRLSFKKYGDFFYVADLSSLLMNTSQKNHAVSRLVSTLFHVSSPANSHLYSEDLSIAILNYINNFPLINREIFREFVDHLLERSRNPNNIRIKLDYGPD